MDINEFKAKAVFTQRIDLSEALDEPGAYIELRELTLNQLGQMNDDGKNNLETLDKFMPDLIIDSSFTKNGGKDKATSSEVTMILRSTGSLYSEILSEAMNHIPFSARLKKQKSDK